METATSYLGLQLPHPFIAGASPFGYSLDRIKRLEDAGCAAVVLHSLFEEQIAGTTDAGPVTNGSGDPVFAFTEFPSPAEYPLAPDAYAEHISRVKQAVRIPVIGSLNGQSAESWLTFGRIIQQAGADALELNVYELVTDLGIPGDDVERRLTAIVRELKQSVSIPVAVKLAPFFTAFGHVARQLDEAGADALVLFNRFYQPDIDVKTMEPSPQLELSTSTELLLRLRWLAILHGRVRPALAVTGGVVEPNDGIKAILAGADVVQVVSALFRHGPAYVSVMRQALEHWMEWHKLSRLDEARGRASLQATRDPAAFERANYIRVLHSWTR